MVHAPAEQVPTEQRLPAGLHPLPLAAATCEHVPSPLQASVVHGLPSSQEPAVQHSLDAFWIDSS